MRKIKIPDVLVYGKRPVVSNYLIERRIKRKAKSLTGEQLLKLCPVRPWVKNIYFVPKNPESRKAMILATIIDYIIKFIPDKYLTIFEEEINRDEMYAFKILLEHRSKFINEIKGGNV